MSGDGMLARWDHAKWLQDRLGEARAENASLTDECERLRAALKAIMYYPVDVNVQAAEDLYDVKELARAALEEADGE